jgi:sigma-B regulation protein RsbU (phosphoserine phosphatase)
VVEDASFVDHTLTLGADDALVLVTDGLLEMENAQHEMYTAERLRAECAGAEPAAGARAIADRLVSAVFGHAAGTPQFDDVTLLVLRLPATG